MSFETIVDILTMTAARHPLITMAQVNQIIIVPCIPNKGSVVRVRAIFAAKCYDYMGESSKFLKS